MRILVRSYGFKCLAVKIEFRTNHCVIVSSNPLSSVEDRLALAIIEDAEASGELKPGQTVVEASESSISRVATS